MPPPGYPNKGPPKICHLNRYPSEPMGCMPGTPPCSVGASACVGMGGYYGCQGRSLTADDQRMPPPPADALNDYESAVVNRWLNNLGADGAPLP